MSHELIETKGVPIRAWVRGVPMEDAARKQLENVAELPIVFRHVAAMPDVHWGMGATVGSVIATRRAVIPAAVGVDIGCGMMAVETTLRAEDLPDDLRGVRSAIEAAVPHGRTNHGGRGDRGAWGRIPSRAAEAWKQLGKGYRDLVDRHPKLGQGNDVNHLGTLGTGNHFIELAKKDMKQHVRNLPDQDLAYLSEGGKHFDDYCEAVEWAQSYARRNRMIMMDAVLEAARATVRPFERGLMAVNCHHNYVAREHHFGADVLVTRKGAVSARLGELGIIPGSMGARSYIVSGKGNPESFQSCSHGAGRAMSRGEAKRRFTLEDHARATEGVECRKDADVIDETPAAYKPIDAVMKAQEDLVEVVHTLRQVVCVKG